MYPVKSTSVLSALFILLVFILSLSACGGEGDDAESEPGAGTDLSAGPVTPTPPLGSDPIIPTVISGSLDTSVIGGSGLKILSSLNGESGISNDGGFSSKVSTEGTQILLATDAEGKLRGLTLSVIPITRVAPGDGINNAVPEILPVDATSTALGVLYFVPGILTIDPALTQVRIIALKQLPCFNPFVSYLKANLPTRSLDDLVVEGTLQDHVTACVGRLAGFCPQ